MKKESRNLKSEGIQGPYETRNPDKVVVGTDWV